MRDLLYTDPTADSHLRARLIPIAASLFIGFVLTAVAASTGAAEEPAVKPNIVVILADDLGFSDLGCYGSQVETPHLDALASEGIRFTQFYNTARCWPTRGALLTGYYAQQIRRDATPGVPGRGQGIRPAWAPLLPELLSKAGYRSFHSGKWHLDGKPIEAGFDRSYWLNDLNRFFDPKKQFLDDQPLPAVDRADGYYSTTEIARHSARFIREHVANAKNETSPQQPFFAYVAFASPHFPLQADPATIAKYKGRFDLGWDRLREQRFAKQQALFDLPTKLSPLEPHVGPPYHFADAYEILGDDEVSREKPWDQLMASQQDFQATKMEIHAAMVDLIDQSVGLVLDEIKKAGAWDDTLIVFLSDNGASAEIMVRGDGHDRDAKPGSADTYLCLGPGFSSAANTPFRRHKTWVHEGGTATPCIMHWPKKLDSVGTETDDGLRHQVAHVIDLFPTLLAAAGTSSLNHQPSGVLQRPGKNLLPTMVNLATIRRDYLWWLHEGNRALRKGDWKIVAAKGQPWELYDLSQDRAECDDLAKRMPDKVDELARIWQQHTDETRERLLTHH